MNRRPAMTKSILILTTLVLLFTPVISYAQQQRPPQPRPPQPAEEFDEEELYPPTNYELFVETPDVVIVTSVFEIGRMTIRGVESGPMVTTHVAWVLDEEKEGKEVKEDKKVYAVKIGDLFLDFEELKPLDDGIGKILKGISDSFEKLGATTMSYQTVGGLLIVWHNFEASSGAMRQNLHLTIRDFSLRSNSTNPLIELRTLIGQARDKLTSLGAK
jgi:hypothetical protein